MPVTTNHLDDAVAIARRYGASRVMLFGRAQSNPDAAHDLDLAIGGVPGWDFYKLAAEIDAALPVPVDVIPLEPESTFTRRVRERGRVIYDEESP
ncbi:MAG: hypothetical protein PPP56_11390 [Longimonas sp.]|uniref:nucleotidyltransferase family protein n=1 Tax=Longimonas sp. TaxID=2039626 RepID=UPI003349E4E0